LIAEPAKGFVGPSVGAIARGAPEIEGVRPGQKSPDFVRGLDSLGAQFHDHYPMMAPKPTPRGSLSAGKAAFLQAHVPLEKPKRRIYFGILLSSGDLWRAIRALVEWKLIIFPY
jgi:hypothetical protein